MTIPQWGIEHVRPSPRIDHVFQLGHGCTEISFDPDILVGLIRITFGTIVIVDPNLENRGSRLTPTGGIAIGFDVYVIDQSGVGIGGRVSPKSTAEHRIISISSKGIGDGDVVLINPCPVCDVDVVPYEGKRLVHMVRHIKAAHFVVPRGEFLDAVYIRDTPEIVERSSDKR